MEQEPDSRSYISDTPERVESVETQLRVSLDRLISIASDYVIYIGDEGFINRSKVTVTDAAGSLVINEYDTASIIQFEANLINDDEGEVDYTHYYLGVVVNKGLNFSDLPKEIKEVVKKIYDDASKKPLIFDGEEHSIVLDVEDAECYRVENIDINFDSNKHFLSWTGVHFEIDGDSYEIDEFGNVHLLTDSMPTRKYRSKNDFDENLIISTNLMEQNIAIDQIEEAMDYMAALIDRD